MKIQGYENYEINRNGSVRRNNRILKPQRNANGYVSVCLCKNGKPINHRVHRLLAKAFIPNPEAKPEINHIDSNRSNNSLDNLEWVTRSENLHHAYHVTRTRVPPRSMLGKFGKDHNRSLSFCIEYPDGRIVKYNSGLEFKRLTGLDHSSISYARKLGKETHLFSHGKMRGLIVHFELHDLTK